MNFGANLLFMFAYASTVFESENTTCILLTLRCYPFIHMFLLVSVIYLEVIQIDLIHMQKCNGVKIPCLNIKRHRKLLISG